MDFHGWSTDYAWIINVNHVMDDWGGTLPNNEVLLLRVGGAEGAPRYDVLRGVSPMIKMSSW